MVDSYGKHVSLHNWPGPSRRQVATFGEFISLNGLARRFSVWKWGNEDWYYGEIFSMRPGTVYDSNLNHASKHGTLYRVSQSAKVQQTFGAKLQDMVRM